MRRNDWELLSALYWAKKGVTRQGLIKEFNRAGDFEYNRKIQWFYDTVGRLVGRGLVSEALSPKGWRRWTITLAGRIEIEKLNEAAKKILEQWEKESR